MFNVRKLMFKALEHIFIGRKHNISGCKDTKYF